jgi:DNA-binding response OmpR family regulator
MAKRILIVEDEAAVRRLMTLALETTGYVVSAAADGVSGLELFGDGSGWDAVLLDQRMPGMDGLTTLGHIKERAPEAVVIMVTAFGSIELAVDAMKLGATDFLRKPLTPEILRAAVASATRDRPVPPVPPRVAARAAAPATAQSWRPDIETLTMNGFRFVSDTPSASEGRYRFRVFTGADIGHGAIVTIRIDPTAVARVERISGRHLPASSSFWQVQAENLLAAYLWTEQRIPEPDVLLVRDASREDMDAAASWTE